MGDKWPSPCPSRSYGDCSENGDDDEVANVGEVEQVGCSVITIQKIEAD